MSLAWGEGPRRPELSSYSALDIECEECGRTKRMQSHEIAQHVARGVHTLIGLHNKLLCSACRERGLPARNINVYPKPRGEHLV